MKHWFSSQNDALVGFVQYAGYRVVAGAPVGPEEHLTELLNEFESASKREGCRVCYFAAESKLEQYAQPRPQYSFLLLGAQPVWHPDELVKRFERKASLRTQINRSANKRVRVEEWDSERATRDGSLKRVLDEWLATRGLPSLHFLVEPDAISNLNDRRLFVATKDGEVVGFLNTSPIPLRHGWLVEQFVRGTSAPNGTIELLLYEMAKTFSSEGYAYLTLGLSPLSRITGEQRSNTSGLIKGALYWAKMHGNRFYNFEGLEFFKSKFEPEYWEPIYAVSNTRRFSLQALYAIACAFTNGHPFAAIIGGIDRAVRQELKWLTKRRNHA